MFNGRKSLMIALSVVMMLAMLVPAAMAAPEVLHGISIDKPTTDKPWYVNADSSGTWYVGFTVTIDQAQVDDVYVAATIINKYQDGVLFDWPVLNNQSAADDNVLANEDLDAGIVTYSATSTPKSPLTFAVSDLKKLNEGWYDLKVCAREADVLPETWLWCDTEENAILVDRTAPAVWLDKPGEIWPQRDPANAIWLTGVEYLVGGAKDVWGLDDESASFQYCVISNFWTSADGKTWNCGPDDNSWIEVTPGDLSCVINEYGGTEYKGYWDTAGEERGVPDDEGVVRICVSDVAGNTSCAGSQVFIDNEFTINLRPGWNLISTPSMLFNSNIEAVLHHLLVLQKVEAVVSYDQTCGWCIYTPAPDPDSLSTIDHGKGYWVNMRGEGDLTFWGTWKSVGWDMPASYWVDKGWNLVGYTHWGRPTAQFFPASYAADYLANIMTPIPGVGDGVQALVHYNAVTGLYENITYLDRMVKGKGYWLATDKGGTIVPAQW